jgi:NADH-quinone oxidoreductase subunit M
LGLPGLAHFPAEFQIFLGGFKQYPWAVAVIILGIAVTAGLYLRAIQIAFLGALPDRWRAMPDLNSRELWAIVPLLALALLIGLVPGVLLEPIHRAVEALRL